MSLNFKLTNIKDYETVCLDENNHIKPITNNIIFSTMAVDMGEITEKNYVEFYTRLLMFDTATQGDYQTIELDDIKAHIGLVCNVITTTKAQYDKKVATIMRRTINEKQRATTKA